MKLSARMHLRLVLMACFGPGLLMLSAGDPSWTAGWAFSGFAVAFTMVSRLLVFARHPDLAAERASGLGKQGIEPWDKTLVPILGLFLPTAIMIAAGLDHRFGGSAGSSLPVLAAGYTLMLAGAGIAIGAARTNAFFSSVVRIQTDRGQTVVSSGPYRWIRHPGYAGGLLFYLGLPLTVGSRWAWVPVALLIALTVLRTGLEDATLRRKLPGYAEYAARVRYRLCPGVW